MFDIYIKDFNRNGTVVTTETLLQTIPAKTENALKFINPIVKNEMGNAESLDFSIESGTAYYDAFLQMKTYIRVDYDGDTIFYGRVLTVDNSGFRGTRRVRCEGPLSFMIDSPVQGVDEKYRPNITIREYIEQVFQNHNNYVNDPNKTFLIGEIPGNYSSAVSSDQQIQNDTKHFGSDSWTDTKSAMEDLRSHYGGYFRTRVDRIGGGIYLDWMNHYFNATTNEQTIEVGKNILDINDVTEIDNIFTAIIPIGNNPSSEKQQDKGLYLDGYRTDIHGEGKVLHVPDIAKIYSDDQLNVGYHKAENYKNAINKYGLIIKTVTFNDSTTKEKLFTDACEWIKNNYQGEVVKFTIKAIDMHQIGQNTSKIMVGDRVNIIYPVGDENGNFVKKTIKLTCLSISYSLYNPENNSYTFGIPANILTKTYGLKKQAQSVNDGATTPRASDYGWGNKEASYEDLLAEWLMTHGLYYSGNKPYKDEYGVLGRDPYQSGGPLYDPNTFSDSTLVKAYRDKKLLDPLSGEPIAVLGTSDDVYPGKYYSDTKWKGSRKAMVDENTGARLKFTKELCAQWHVYEYVKYEYDYDLLTQLGLPGPTIVDDGEGNVTVYETYDDPENERKIAVKALLLSKKPSDMERVFETTALGPDGETVKSVLDKDGNYSYWYIDNKTGEVVETNIRDLNITAIQSSERIGWVVTENQEGEYEFANPGEMTMAIEKFQQGELVVTRVSGELMYLGNTKTQYLTSVSLNHMDNVCGDFEYVRDDQGIKVLKVNSGGGMRVTHAKKDPTTGEYIVGPDGQLITAEFGIFDDNTLTGGIVVDKINDGTTVTKINGDRVDIEAEQVRIGTTSNVKAWMNTNGEKIEQIEGSTLWLERNNITGIVGEFELRTDAQGKRRLVVKSGGGIKIERNNTEFGIYDNGTLDAGVIVSKINDGTNIGSNKILGTRVNIKADQVVVGEASNVQAWMNDTDTDFDTLSGLVADTITAYNARFNTIEADYLKTSELKTAISYIDELSVKKILLGGNIVFPKGDQYEDYRKIGNAVYDVKIEPPASGSNTYTLKKLELFDDDWTDAGTFSRAISSWATDSWNTTNGAITVKALPQNQSHTVQTNLRITGNGSSNTCSAAIGTIDSGGNFTSKYTVPVYLTVDSTGASGTVSIRNKNDTTGVQFASISVSGVWSAGRTSGYNSGWGAAVGKLSIPTTTVTNNNTITVKYPPATVDGAATARTYYIENTSGDNNKVDLITNGVTVARYSHGKWTAGYNDAVSRLETKSIDSNGTYTPSSGKIGFSSITVSVPSNADSIDIPNTQITVANEQPASVSNPTELTKLPNSIKNNHNTWVWFRVDVKDSSGTIIKSKWYKCASA